MSQLGSQKDYWNSRATVKGNYGPPLNLSPEEISFQQKFLVPGGNSLILGATTALCTIARDISAKVTSVDFAEDIIKALQIKNVEYILTDWIKYFEQNNHQFDNIMTDGGLLCLNYPENWQKITDQIYNHLKPGGFFTAKAYVSTPKPPKPSQNPSINRFMTLMPHQKDDWMVVPTHGDYKKYDVHYALPPDEVVQQMFSKFELKEKFIPDYEAGENFLSYAWQRS